jgi:HK97 family phage portal protein
MLKDLFKRKNVIVAEKKSVAVDWPWLINGGEKGTNTQMTIKRALTFYDDCAPVATAIDWINDEFKTLTIVLKAGDETERNADILRFLRNPNDDMTQEDFLENLGAYFLITGEVYIIALGMVNKKPSELLVVSPEFVTPEKGRDGFVTRMRVKIAGMTEEIFKRDENQYRFYNKDLTAEIWQIKGFSAIGDTTQGQSGVIGVNNLSNARGRSKLSSIHREINQYIEIATHNLSSLDNGMVPSGSIEVPEGQTLTDDQFEALREQVIDFYSGSKNTGKVLILDNGLKFVPASKSAKDMDFERLSRRVEITVFNRYKVPLPLVSPDNMTLANMESAKLNLYDNCVIPLAQRLFRELTGLLAPRFGLTEDVQLAIDFDDITALQIRRNEELKLKKELDVLTKDELRKKLGEEETPGGNILYMTNNMIPLGSSLIPVNNPLPSPQDDNDDTSNAIAKSIPDIVTRKDFISILQNQVDKKGNKIFTDIEINEIADSEGL